MSSGSAAIAAVPIGKLDRGGQDGRAPRLILDTSRRPCVMTTIYRADHIGSLLRPQEVLDAHAAQARGEISLERLREIEDAAITQVLELQRQIGLDVLSDGEYRRSSWAGGFPEAVDGYVSSEMPIAFQWRLPDSLASDQAKVDA